MAASLGQIRFVKYDADGRIDHDLPCLKCGYNLRTLLDDGQCPECGTSIHESARLAWLCQHDPVWLRRLGRSTVWIGIAMVCVALILSLSLLAWTPWRPPDEAAVVLLPLLVAGTVAGLIGFWQITAPHRGGEISRLRVRRVARWTMAAGLAGFLVVLLVDEFSLLLREISFFLFACDFVCLGVGACATLTHAATLAAKIPEARLVKQVRIVAWGFALGFSLLCAQSLIEGTEQTAFAGMDAISVTILIIGIAGLLILSVWTIPLLIWYRRRFREAVRMRQR